MYSSQLAPFNCCSVPALSKLLQELPQNRQLHFLKCSFLDLAHSLAGHAQLLTYRFKRVPAPVTQSVTQFDDISFALPQLCKHTLDLLAQVTFGHSLEGVGQLLFE